MKTTVTYTVTMEVEADQIENLSNKLQGQLDYVETEFGAEIIDETTKVEFSDDAAIDDKIDFVGGDYHNDAKGYTSIDVWFIGSDDGFVAAHVYDNGFVEWVNPSFTDSIMVREVIEAVKESLKK
jgi:hypothetical protein